MPRPVIPAPPTRSSTSAATCSASTPPTPATTRTSAGERVAAEYVAGEARRGRHRRRSCASRRRAGPTWSPASRAPTRRRGALLVHGHLDVVPADAERVVGAPVLRRDPGRLPVGPRRDRHEGLRRDGARGGPRVAAHRRTCRRATSCSPSPPTRRPAATTARTSWSTSTAELFDGCTEAIGEVGGFSYTVSDDLRLYLIETAEKGIDWLRLHATRPARPRLVRARRQRGHRAGRGGRPGRPAPVPDRGHPDRAGVPGAGLRRARHRARPGRPGAGHRQARPDRRP